MGIAAYNRDDDVYLEDAPPIAGAADPEYQTRIQADQVTAQFAVGLQASKPQESIDELPLFGGERQQELWERGAG